MKKLGIYVDSIEYSQLFLRLNSELEKVRDELNVTLFFNNHGRMLDKPAYDIMPAYNIWKTNFPVIATDIMAAKFLANALTVREKYFYIWSHDWLMRSSDSYMQNISVYCDPNIKLLVRSPAMLNIVKNVWKEPAGILYDFDHQQLLRLGR